MTKPVTALRKLNKTLEQHGVRLCEACGDCHPLTAEWFYRKTSPGFFQFTCIACRRAQNIARYHRQSQDPEWLQYRRDVSRVHYQKRRRPAVRENRLSGRERDKLTAFERILSNVRITVERPAKREQSA